MTLDYLKDLLFDALNESRDLPLTDLSWDNDQHRFLLTTEDGSAFLLTCEENG